MIAQVFSKWLVLTLVIFLVLWWSLQMMATCSNESVSAKTSSSSWRRSIYGRLWSKLWRACQLCMRWRSYIETWRAPIFSSIEIRLPNLVTSMYQRLPKKASCILRPVHHITRVLRYGEISHMIWSRIFGPLVVLSMRCVPWSHHSEQMTWMDFSRKCWRDNIHQFQVITPWICACLSKHFYR